MSIPEGASGAGYSTDRLNRTGGVKGSHREGMGGTTGYPSGLLPTLGLTKYKDVDL